MVFLIYDNRDAFDLTDLRKGCQKIGFAKGLGQMTNKDLLQILFLTVLREPVLYSLIILLNVNVYI